MTEEDKAPGEIHIYDLVQRVVKSDQAQRRKKQPTYTDDDVDDIIVTLNVGGSRHETKISTLLKKPETRLYTVAQTAKASGKSYFFFDRNPEVFPYILNFYRIGKLHLPHDICGPVAKAELDYWELDDKEIEQCCWVKYISYEETMDMLKKFEEDEQDRHTDSTVTSGGSLFQKLRPKIWHALEDPYSSKGALTYAIFSLIVVGVSIIVFVIETLPYFGSVMVHAADEHDNITSADLREELNIFTDVTPNDILLLFDNGCNVFFLLEFLVKLVTTPSKRQFFLFPLSIIELVCIVPYYIAVTIIMVHPDPVKVFLFIRILFATRVLRIFRIFVLMKHFLALKILIYTIRASTKELLLLLLVLLIGVVIFACSVYYLEIFSGEPSDFVHIPFAFWWALITMTTVGYGDIVPKTGLGYAGGAVCAISGILVIALSVPVIVNNFTVYYSHAQSREKLRKKKIKEDQKARWNKIKTGFKLDRQKILTNGTSNILRRSNAVEPLPFVTKIEVKCENIQTDGPSTSTIILEDADEESKPSSDYNHLHGVENGSSDVCITQSSSAREVHELDKF